MKTFTTAITIIGATVFCSTQAQAGDDLFLAEVSVGGTAMEGQQGAFARVDGLFKITGNLYMGLEAEHTLGLSNNTKTIGFSTTKGLNYSSAVYSVARIDLDEFAVQVRTGLRNTSYQSETSGFDFDIGGVDVGLGGIYRLDKNHQHGIRADLTFSTELSLFEDEAYDTARVVAQIGYSYKF